MTTPTDLRLIARHTGLTLYVCAPVALMLCLQLAIFNLDRYRALAPMPAYPSAIGTIGFAGNLLMGVCSCTFLATLGYRLRRAAKQHAGQPVNLPFSSAQASPPTT